MSSLEQLAVLERAPEVAHRHIVAVIPAYNEERFIGSVVLQTCEYADTVIVVDDGSTDGTAAIARAAGAVVVQHEENGGKGTALNTAMAAARDYDPDVVVMLDADGQHLPHEMRLVAEPVLNDAADIVVGSRYLEQNSTVPRYRIWGHAAFNFVTNRLSGVSLTDTQSGFRAFSRKALEVISFQSDGFSVESEMQFLADDHDLEVVEVPITIQYRDAPKRPVVAHGLMVLNGILQLVGQYRPLLFFGVPGGISVLAVWYNRWALVSVPLGILVLVGGVLRYGSDRLLLPLLSPDHPLGIAVVLRLDMWSRALAMIRDAPYTGIGLNAFPVVQTHFYPGVLLGPEPHAHNLFLQTALDVGVPGLAAFLWLVVVVFLTIRRTLRATDDRDVAALLIGIAAGTLAYLTYGVFDVISVGGKPAPALWAMFGLVAVTRHVIDEPRADREVPLRLYDLSGGAVILLIGFTTLLLAHPSVNLAVLRSHRAIVSARTAVVPPNDVLPRAATLLEQALVHAPGDADLYARLASVRAWQGEHAAAFEALQRSVTLDAPRPGDSYAPYDRLRRRLRGAGEPPDTADELLNVYKKRMRRYPERAETYVRVALVWHLYTDDPQRAAAIVESGLDHGAEPEGLLRYSLSQFR